MFLFGLLVGVAATYIIMQKYSGSSIDINLKRD